MGLACYSGVSAGVFFSYAAGWLTRAVFDEWSTAWSIGAGSAIFYSLMRDRNSVSHLHDIRFFIILIVISVVLGVDVFASVMWGRHEHFAAIVLVIGAVAGTVDCGQRALKLLEVNGEGG